MAISRDVLEGALRDAVVAASGLPDERVLHEHQSTPKQVEPCIVVNAWLSSSKVGMDEERLDPDLPGVIFREGQRRITAAVNVYGPYAVEGAEKVAERLMGEEARALLELSGLAVLSRGEVRNMARLLDSGWGERAMFELVLGAVVAWQEDVGYITSVGLQSELAASGETLESDKTIP